MKTRISRASLASIHDLLAGALAWCLAYLLRFNFDLPPIYQAEMWRTLLWVVPLEGAIFWGLGLYRGLWRYASVADLRRILLAALAAAVLVPLVLWMFRVHAVVPRSVMVTNSLLMLMVFGLSVL